MGRYTEETTMRAIFTDPLLKPICKYLTFKPDRDTAAESRDKERLEQIPDVPLRKCASGWASSGVVRGLNLLAQEIEHDRLNQYFIYGENNCSDDPMKRDVNVIRFLPREEAAANAEKPYIILAGGGAYQWVSNMVESIPTAVHMVARGYTVFLLTYRVNTEKAALKSLDDLAAAIRYIAKHKGVLGIQTDRYVLGGFSAGANLISNFGVPQLGYCKYSLPKPAALFPIYTFIDLKTQSNHNCIGDLLKPMFGSNYADYLDAYNIIDHINNTYPPCYIVCGKDDMSVPPVNSEQLMHLLQKAGVPAILEEGDHAPHAFGDGTGTDVEGWPDRAIDFLESL